MWLMATCQAFMMPPLVPQMLFLSSCSGLVHEGFSGSSQLLVVLVGLVFRAYAQSYLLRWWITLGFLIREMKSVGFCRWCGMWAQWKIKAVTKRTSDLSTKNETDNWADWGTNQEKTMSHHTNHYKLPINHNEPAKLHYYKPPLFWTIFT